MNSHEMSAIVEFERFRRNAQIRTRGADQHDDPADSADGIARWMGEARGRSVPGGFPMPKGGHDERRYGRGVIGKGLR